MDSTTNPHFSAFELRDVFTRGLDEAQRYRAMQHFSVRCGCCERNLTDLAEGKLGAEMQAPAGSWDPVLQALWRRVQQVRAEGSPEGALPFLARLRPWHRRWVTDRGSPFSFCIQVLEEGRQAALEDRTNGLDRGKDTLSYFDFLAGRRAAGVSRKTVPSPGLRRRARWRRPDDELTALAPRLAAHNEERLKLIRILALVYLGDAHRLEADHFEALKAIRQADAALEEYADHKTLWDIEITTEIRATLDELRSDLARTEGNFGRALEFIQRAIRTRETDGSSLGLPEALVRMGMIQLKEDGGAVETFRRALDLIEDGSDPQLSRVALHHLAVAEIQKKNFTNARRWLREAEPLYADCNSLRTLSQRAWMQGIVDLYEGEYETAEKYLRESLAGLLELGLVFDGLLVVVNLGQLFMKADRPDRDLVSLSHEFRELLRRPEVEMFILEQIERGLRFAPEVPGLEDLIRRMESGISRQAN